MGKIDVDVDLNGVPGKIERAVEDGVKDSDTELYDQGTDAAKAKLRQEGAVWKGELINSFTFDTDNKGNVTLVKIKNIADHAVPMEDGAEYGKEGPPIDSLLPWAQDKLSNWQVSEKWVSLAEEYLDIPAAEFQSNKKLYAKTFWLQQKIKHQGLEGRKFMEAMDNFLELYGDDIVGHEIDKQIRRRL